MQAPGEQAVIQRPPESDLHRLGGSGRRDGQDPAGRVDVAALVVADLVPPLRPGSQGEPVRITEPAVDHEPEWLARSQRVAGLAVAGQAALDAGGVQQDGEPAAGRRPTAHARRAARPRGSCRRHRRRAARARRRSPRSSAPRTRRRAGAGCMAPRPPSGGCLRTSVVAVRPGRARTRVAAVAPSTVTV